jgi:lipase chaperone LimK
VAALALALVWRLGFDASAVGGASRALTASGEPAFPWSRASVTAGSEAKSAAPDRSLLASAAASAPSSLTGTEPDGAWPLDAQGDLAPNIAVRRRFDYFLTLTGERSLPEIKAAMLESAQSLAPRARASVERVWTAYVGVHQHAWASQVDLRDPRSWSAALAERRSVRRQRLGPAWAHAFYAEEESELERMIASVNSGSQAVQAVVAVANQPPALPDAPQREAATQQEWAAWEARLEAARQQLQAIESNPAMSSVQRREAIDRWLIERFSGTDLMRVRALLQLPG